MQKNKIEADKKWNAEKSLLRHYINEGWTPTRIAKEYGVDRSTIYFQCGRMGLKFSIRSESRKRYAVIKNKVGKLFDDGNGITQIATLIKISRTTVRKYVTAIKAARIRLTEDLKEVKTRWAGGVNPLANYEVKK